MIDDLEILTPIPLDNALALQAYALKNRFTYVSLGDKQSTRLNQLCIAPVALLSAKQDVVGVFATEDLAVETDEPEANYLGLYEGKRVYFDALESGYDTSYLFELADEDWGIDAREAGNWTRFVNTSSCQANANVQAVSTPEGIAYYLIRPVKKGQQLMIYYGDVFAFPKEQLRFLRASDNWNDSTAILKQNRTYYCEYPISLMASMLQYFQVEPSQLFFVPHHSVLQDSLRVDLPFLATHADGSCLVQCQQENITYLMVACWQGDIERVEIALQYGANPNIQSSISGVSALHLLVAAPIEDAQKIRIIALFIQHQAILHLQDKDNLSILHWAIRSHSISLINHLIELGRRERETDFASKDEGLLDCVDSEERDFFLYAMHIGFSDVVRLFVNEISIHDLRRYCETDSARDILQHYLLKTDDQGFFKLLQRIIYRAGRTQANAALLDTLNALKHITFHEQEAVMAWLPDAMAYYTQPCERFSPLSMPHFLSTPSLYFLRPDSQKLTAALLKDQRHSLAFSLPLLACHAEGEALSLEKQVFITPLMMACWHGAVREIEYWLHQGTNPDAKTRPEGYAALHIVCKAPLDRAVKKKIIGSLLHYGAKRYIQTAQGETVLHLLIEQGNLDLITSVVLANRMKKEDGAVISGVNAKGQDPFLCAIENEQHQIVDFLIAYLDLSHLSAYLKDELHCSLVQQYLEKAPHLVHRLRQCMDVPHAKVQLTRDLKLKLQKHFFSKAEILTKTRILRLKRSGFFENQPNDDVYFYPDRARSKLNC